MKQQFYNRENETDRLERFIKSGIPGLIILYGRRRYGKSTLLQRTLATREIYFQADQREVPLQLESLATSISHRLKDFDKVKYRSWDELLTSLYARADQLIYICLDEFPYLVQTEPALPSILQRFIDRKDGNIGWLLSGSSQRMMHSMVMDKKAPLYGRAREIIKLQPLSAGWLMPALSLNATNAVKAYAIWGGVPRYWELVAEYKDQQNAIKDLVWSPHGVLHKEPERLLIDDLRSAVQPYSILSLIGNGCHRPSEIAARLEKPLSSLARPLSLLCELGYVRRDVPFGEDRKKTRRALYRLNDQFLQFFFRFVLPYQSSLAQWIIHEAAYRWQHDQQHLFANCWEDLCRSSVPRLKIWNHIQFGIASSWWQQSNKEAEIDVVALSPDKKNILLGECKWSNRKKRFNLTAIDQQLRKKAELLPAIKGKKIITSCWLGGNAQTTGNIDHLITPDNVMKSLMF